MEHGTPKAASRHRRAKERLCALCRRSENGRRRVYTKARHAAIEELIRRHREEFDALYEKHKEAGMAEPVAKEMDTAERNRRRSAAYVAALRQVAHDNWDTFQRYYADEKASTPDRVKSAAYATAQKRLAKEHWETFQRYYRDGKQARGL